MQQAGERGGDKMDEGYMMLIAECFACGRLMTCNPNRVPSVQNQPICKECMEEVNRLRVEAGMETFFVPDDAYEPTPAY
jgi:hypothetical protein